MMRTGRYWLCGWTLCALLWLSSAAAMGVQLRVEAQDLGLEGVIRVGQWNALRVHLLHQGANPRTVVVRWLLRDPDGEQVAAERRMTLTPGVEAIGFLYGPLPADQDHRPWPVQVLDADDGRLLTQVLVGVPGFIRGADDPMPPGHSARLPADVGAIGLCGTVRMGLEPYTRTPDTQHEQQVLISQLQLPSLPDRWYGLSTLSALIWTPQGGNPQDMPESVQMALRQWIERGGHLVIVLPLVGEPWTQSPLADLLPVGREQMQRIGDFDPLLLGSLPADTQAIPSLPAIVFDTSSGQRAEPLLYARPGSRRQPWVVASRVGFGRVTLVGVDLTSPQVIALGLPNGQRRLWNDIFHWTAPAYNRSTIDAMRQGGELSRPETRERHRLGLFISAMTSMRGTATTTVVLAVLFVGVYWLVAGPICFYVLRQRGLGQYNWQAFMALVLLFSALAWGGALLLRPQQLQLEHFSVLDVDLHSGTMQSRSYMAIFVPHFGQVDLAIAPEQRSAAYNTLAALGYAQGLMETATAFLDSRRYRIDAANPDRIALPVRSTAKQLQAAFLGSLDAQAGLRDPWPTPQLSDLRMVEGFPAGTITHQWPGTVEDVLAVFAPGDGRQAFVWRLGHWAPGEPLEINARPSDRLVITRPVYDAQRNWASEGYLGQLVGKYVGTLGALQPVHLGLSTTVAPDTVKQQIDMLSFFGAMPPPNFRAMLQSATQQRLVGREIDLSSQLVGRRLLLIGHLPQSSMPMPLTLDGRTIEQQTGWTSVRCIIDLHP